jgi:hypothetical protein
MLSCTIVPSRSSAPKRSAVCAVAIPIATQYALMCGMLSSISREIASVRRLSIAVGSGSLRRLLFSLWNASGMKHWKPFVSSWSSRSFMRWSTR